MERDSAYFLEASAKTRNLGLVMSLILVPVVFAFVYIDSISPPFHGIFWWRIGAVIPALLYLCYALFLFPKHPRAAIPLHAVQLIGLIVMMCGISADLATRPDFPEFARTALISSLLLCIFADFAFAAGARKYLAAILVPPLAAMSVYTINGGEFLTQMQRLWLISNPAVMAVALSILALYQERSSVREFKVHSELKRAEAERQAGLQRLEFIIATARTGLDIIDEDLVVRYIDPARMKILGEPGGRVCYDYFRGRSTPCDDCAVQRALETRKVQVQEQTPPRDDHQPTMVTALPYQDDSGTWLVAEVIVDISERKKAEAERLDLERRIATSQRLEGLGILAGGVAHNFNNLLMVILGHAELLRESMGMDSAMTSSVNEIIRAGDRSRDLVSQLLSLGRRRALDLRPLDLNLAIRESSAMLRQALRENIAVDYRLAATPFLVAADPGRIEEILLNLALNAQDAITREGRIQIATAEVVRERVFSRRQEDLPPGRYVQLTFGDTGQGMARETLTKLFTPFFTTKEQGKGTGLGLYTVYSIVKEHNGTIEVESHPGAGARFLICFPLIEAPALEAPAFTELRPAKGAETILLVEDEEPIRTMLSHRLRNLGYTVLEASDGVSALQVFADHGKAVHLLVSDVVMPCMSGTDLYDQLRGQMPLMKVLFISGYPREVISTHVVKDQEMELLAKPFTGQALASRVREILDR